MPPSLEEWSDQYRERVFDRQTAQVETVKLIVTFALGISATIVATALQVQPQGPWDTASVITLGLAFFGAVAAVITDRLKLPDLEKALQRAKDRNWDSQMTLDYLRALMRDAKDENDRVVRMVRRAAEYQVLLSSSAAVFAVVSLYR